MRQGQKRSRGRNNTYNANQRGNQSNKNILTRSHESNGPDVKVRGTPAAIVEKYQQLARDAQSAGDGVMAEAYYQHAEHYYRLIQLHTAQQEEQQREREAREQKEREAREARGDFSDRGDRTRSDRDDEDADGEDGRGRRGRRRRNRDDRDERSDRGERSDRSERDFQPRGDREEHSARSDVEESADAPAPTLAASDADAGHGGVIGDPPQDAEEKPRRKRRTKAEMEAARAAEASEDGEAEVRPRTRRPRKAKEPSAAPDAEVAGNTADELPSFIADPAE